MRAALRGFLLAPIAPIVIWGTLFGIAGARIGEAEGGLLAIPLVAAYAYLWALVLGIPTYFLLRRDGPLSRRTCIGFGLFLGWLTVGLNAGLVALVRAAEGAPAQISLENFLMSFFSLILATVSFQPYVMLALLSGGSAGFVFWYVARPDRQD